MGSKNTSKVYEALLPFLNVEKVLAFYTKHLGQDLEISGRNALALCPFHDDRAHPNFMISIDENQKLGLAWCNACRKGCSPYSLLIKVCGMCHENAIKELKSFFSLPDGTLETKVDAWLPLKLEEFAHSKRIPLGWLKDHFPVSQSCYGRDKTPCVAFDYFDRERSAAYRHLRFSSRGRKWAYGGKERGKDFLFLPREALYGKLQGADHVLVCEGESDTIVSWFLEHPAVGLPGAGSPNRDLADQIVSLRIPSVFIPVDADEAGERYALSLAQSLNEARFQGKVGLLYFCDLEEGTKDVGSLLPVLGKKLASATMNQLVRDCSLRPAGEVVKALRQEKLFLPESIRARLDIPLEYEITRKRGIVKIVGDQETLCCAVPFAPSARVDSDEGVAYKVSYYSTPSDSWDETVISAELLADENRCYRALSRLGLFTSSREKRAVTGYIADVIAANLHAMPQVDVVTKTGWHSLNDDKVFIPYMSCDELMPKLCGVEPGAYETRGMFTDQMSLVVKCREYPIPRTMIAAAFAAPLLDVTGSRQGVIHLWGPSGSGKTATQYLVASLAGDPDKLMINFDYTRNRIRDHLAESNHLPVLLSELQVSSSGGDPVKEQRSRESLIYAICEGKDRGRLTSKGKPLPVRAYKNILITSGEQPLLQQNCTQDGIRNRVLELRGTPFPDENIASRIYQACRENHGHLMKAFVKQLAQMDESTIRIIFDSFLRHPNLLKLQDKIGISLPKFRLAALIGTGDQLSQEFLLGKDRIQASQSAVDLVSWLLEQMRDDQAGDLVDSAKSFILSWLEQHDSHFEVNVGNQSIHLACPGGHWGFVDQEENVALIRPKVLRNTLSMNGFNPGQVLSGFVDRAFIRTNSNRGRNTHYLKPGTATRRSEYYVLDLTQMGNPAERNDDKVLHLFSRGNSGEDFIASTF